MAVEQARVVEHVTIGTSGIATAGTLEFTEEARPGDAVLVVFVPRDPRTVAMTGGGASWALMDARSESDYRSRYTWLGIDYQGGPIAYTCDTASPGGVHAFLLRGVGDATQATIAVAGEPVHTGTTGAVTVAVASARTLTPGEPTSPVTEFTIGARTVPAGAAWGRSPVEAYIPGGAPKRSGFVAAMWRGADSPEAQLLDVSNNGGGQLLYVYHVTVGAPTIANVTHNTSGAAVTLHRPAGVRPGDVMIAQLRLFGETYTAPAGWDLVADTYEGGDIDQERMRHLVYTRTATESEPTSWTWSGSYGPLAFGPGGGIVAFSGLVVTGSTTATGVYAGGTSVTVPTAGDATVDAVDGVVLAFLADGNNAVPAGTTTTRRSSGTQLWGVRVTDYQQRSAAGIRAPLSAGTTVSGPTFTNTSSQPDTFQGTAWSTIVLLGVFATPPDPDPVIPEPETFVPEVRVDGVIADVDTVRVVSNTPAHLMIPPRGGNIAGAEAELEWEWPQDVSTQAEQPWSGDYRPVPSATVTIDVPDPDGTLFRAFTGEIDTTEVSLAGAPLRSRCVDPLVDVEAEFSAPALTRSLPLPREHTPDERPRINLQTIWYAERAMEAVGCRSTIPRTPATVWHQSMCGSIYPAHGSLAAGGQWNAGAPVVPSPSPSMASMGDGSGRVGCTNPFVLGDVEPWGGPADAPWTLMLELDPSTVATGADTNVRFYDASEGIQARIIGPDLRLAIVPAAGTTTTVATLDRTGATRALIRYAPATGTLTAVLDTAPTVIHEVTGLSLPGLTTAYGRVRIAGQGATAPAPISQWPVAIGAVSVYRDGPPLDEDENLLWPRRFAVHITPDWSERWWLQAQPAIVAEPAVRWVTQAAHREQALLWTDHEGVTHWADTVAFDDLPTTGLITDARIDPGATAVPLDELTHTVRRRDRISRVRVTGLRGSSRWSGGAVAGREALRARQTIKLQVGDDPVELWLTPEDGTFWTGPLDLAWRQAGGPWGKDFERGRGSFWGGHVVDADGDPARWATSTDVTVTVDEVGYDAVKVTLTPGPSLAAGETFVNLPHPDSTGLERYPEVRDAPLPVLNAWSVTETIEVEGVSTDLGASAYPEYVHEAGWSAGWVDGERTPEQLAQMLADRHLSHVGEIVVTCAAAPVRIGQRWTVQVTGPADLTFDAVVLGVLDLSASAGRSSMTLRMWALSVDAPEPVEA